MKGILKIYHQEETIKYSIVNTYCKAVYINEQYYLETEIQTDDSLEGVDDDSLHYLFPQLCLKLSDYPITTSELAGETFVIDESGDVSYTEINLFDDVDAFLYDNELTFSYTENQELQLIWKGTVDDFYTNTDQSLAFKLKCIFREDDISIDDE